MCVLSNALRADLVHLVEHVLEVALGVDADALHAGHDLADDLLPRGRVRVVLELTQVGQQVAVDEVKVAVLTRVRALLALPARPSHDRHVLGFVVQARIRGFVWKWCGPIAPAVGRPEGGGVKERPTASLSNCSRSSCTSRMRRKRIHVSSGTYCIAPAQLPRRMMSQMDQTAWSTDWRVASLRLEPLVLPFRVALGMVILCRGPSPLVAGIDQVDRHVDDDGLLSLLAHCDEQGQGDQGIVRNAPPTVDAAQQAVLLHEPEEQGGCDALVAVHEAVILDEEVEQVGGLEFQAGIDVRAVESLHNRVERAMEALIFLTAEIWRHAEPGAQRVDNPERLLVSYRHDRRGGGGLRTDALVVVIVEQVQARRRTR